MDLHNSYFRSRRSDNDWAEIIFVVEEAPEGGCVTRALGHSIVTEADTLDELRRMVRDAVACHFEDVETSSLPS